MKVTVGHWENMKLRDGVMIIHCTFPKLKKEKYTLKLYYLGVGGLIIEMLSSYSLFRRQPESI